MRYAGVYRARRVACGAFEATSLLVTGGVVILCVMVAIKGEDRISLLLVPGAM